MTEFRIIMDIEAFRTHILIVRKPLSKETRKGGERRKDLGDVGS